MDRVSECRVNKSLFKESYLDETFIYRSMIKEIMDSLDIIELSRPMRFELFSICPETINSMILTPHEVERYAPMMSQLEYSNEKFYQVKLIFL
jgi:hypothetical protein